MLRDGRNTIAITLLRATNQIGDWGVFPTPDAQCYGMHVFEYAIIPHSGNLESSRSDIEARAFNAPLSATQIKKSKGNLPLRSSFIDLQPQKLVLSCIKKSEKNDSLIVRFYNPYNEVILSTINIMFPVNEAYLCNLAEERLEKLECINNSIVLEVQPKKIITCEFI